MLLRRFLLPLLLSLTVAAGLTTGIVATSHATGPAPNPTVIVGKKSQPPVKVARVSGFGRILVTARGFALYSFTPERNGAIKCSGGCAKVWPPLLLPKGAAAPATVPGVPGRFSVVVRPEGTRQLTYRGRPLYTYVDDKKPGQVLCDGVNGWFAVRVSAH